MMDSALSVHIPKAYIAAAACAGWELFNFLIMMFRDKIEQGF